MHLHDIDKLINLQGVKAIKISEVEKNKVFITLQPTQTHQSCPNCGGTHVIKRGISCMRKIRHLDLWEHQTILVVPSIRLTCQSCGLNFSWHYDFVKDKSRYTNAFKDQLAGDIDGSTVSHVVNTRKVPYTTGERLVIGIDDFAIRKGHTYNTGIHDLRNGSLLCIASGRRCEEFLRNKNLQEVTSQLQPIAIVMDLARSYHNYAKEVFPTVIRIADRFHVNRYITEALHAIRKRITRMVSPRQAKQVKRSKHLLGKRYDSLTVK